MTNFKDFCSYLPLPIIMRDRHSTEKLQEILVSSDNTELLLTILSARGSTKLLVLMNIFSLILIWSVKLWKIV